MARAIRLPDGRSKNTLVSRCAAEPYARCCPVAANDDALALSTNLHASIDRDAAGRPDAQRPARRAAVRAAAAVGPGCTADPDHRAPHARRQHRHPGARARAQARAGPRQERDRRQQARRRWLAPRRPLADRMPARGFSTGVGESSTSASRCRTGAMPPLPTTCVGSRSRCAAKALMRAAAARAGLRGVPSDAAWPRSSSRSGRTRCRWHHRAWSRRE